MSIKEIQFWCSKAVLQGGFGFQKVPLSAQNSGLWEEHWGHQEVEVESQEGCLCCRGDGFKTPEHYQLEGK